MTNFELGTRLVEACNKAENLEFINNFYAENIISIEAMNNPGDPETPREQKGIEAIRAKNAWWNDNHEVHANNVTGPFPHGDDKFAVYFSYDVTFKPVSQRMTMEEVGVYTIENGKIVREEFFYHMG